MYHCITFTSHGSDITINIPSRGRSSQVTVNYYLEEGAMLTRHPPDSPGVPPSGEAAPGVPLAHVPQPVRPRRAHIVSWGRKRHN